MSEQSGQDAQPYNKIIPDIQNWDGKEGRRSRERARNDQYDLESWERFQFDSSGEGSIGIFQGKYLWFEWSEEEIIEDKLKDRGETKREVNFYSKQPIREETAPSLRKVSKFHLKKLGEVD